MGNIRLASPLFILREACGKDLFSVLEKLQAIGYDGCELLGFFGHEAQEIADYLRKANWRAMGNHVPFDEFDADFEQVMNDHLLIGCEYITIQLPEACQPGGDQYDAAIAKVEKWAKQLADQGITLIYHNHAGEFTKTEYGNALIKLMADMPSLKLEPDLGWMGIAGENPADYLARYHDRAPVLHFKDYFRAPGAEAFKFRPTGYGILNYPALMALSLACDPKWIVVDHDDAYENDTYDELAISLQYVRELLKLSGR